LEGLAKALAPIDSDSCHQSTLYVFILCLTAVRSAAHAYFEMLFKKQILDDTSHVMAADMRCFTRHSIHFAQAALPEPMGSGTPQWVELRG
jgi:hypothetical protein